MGLRMSGESSPSRNARTVRVLRWFSEGMRLSSGHSRSESLVCCFERKRCVQRPNCIVNTIRIDDACQPDFARGNQLDVDPGIEEGAEHPGRITVSGLDADAHDADLAEVTIRDIAGRADTRANARHDRLGAAEILAGEREREICQLAFAGVLDDCVDAYAGLGQRLEEVR